MFEVTPEGEVRKVEKEEPKGPKYELGSKGIGIFAGGKKIGETDPKTGKTIDYSELDKMGLKIENGIMKSKDESDKRIFEVDPEGNIVEKQD